MPDALSDLPARPVPEYIVHTVDEDELTVDWFFGRGPWRRKVPQFLLGVVGWAFTILPVWITVSAIVHRNDRTGWWSYREGFLMFRVTVIILVILLAAFIVVYLSLYFLDRRVDGWRRDHVAYDVERLDLRLAIAEDLYSEKFGPESARLAQRSIRIEPESDLETYELRDRYREYDVGVE